MLFKHLICCSASSDSAISHETQIDLSHFRMLRVIGKGTYACVRAVERKNTKGLYALKYVDKAKCARAGAATNVVQERMLLEEVDHPFLVNMHFAFQDDINCYFILDLMLGGDLKFHRLRRGSLGEIAMRICHRDVKPENILLDFHGHAHLTDFNVATHYSEDEFHSSVAGTMIYMAPEMLSRTGYSWQVDYWSLGVTAYECLFFGQRPFADKCKDPQRVKQSIMKDPLAFPDGSETVCSADGMAALAALLERDPGKRLGCKTWSRRRGQSDLRNHPWFRHIDWGKLEARQLAPPFLPDDKAWNFDDFDDSSMSDKALLHRINRLSHMSEKISSEQRHLEDNFPHYDSEKMSRKSYYTHNKSTVGPYRATMRESMLSVETLRPEISSSDERQSLL